MDPPVRPRDRDRALTPTLTLTLTLNLTLTPTPTLTLSLALPCSHPKPEPKPGPEQVRLPDAQLAPVRAGLQELAHPVNPSPNPDPNPNPNADPDPNPNPNHPRCEFTFKNSYDPEAMLPRYVEARAHVQSPTNHTHYIQGHRRLTPCSHHTHARTPLTLQARAREGVPREAQVPLSMVDDPRNPHRAR